MTSPVSAWAALRQSPLSERLFSSLRLHQEELARKLADELAARWLQGEPILAEFFLRQHPELADHAEALLQLLYEEICQREHAGETDAVETVKARFPEWATQLDTLLECHRLLNAESDRYQVGDEVGDFVLLAELGRGMQGAVFLARQRSLADRPVVLKITPRTGQEHLSLARLQHTNIVPLFSVVDDLVSGNRMLCMPYFGGASLAKLLELLEPIPPAKRTSRHFLHALDTAQASQPIVLPQEGSLRTLIAEATYASALAWIGACLADALHYAHERQLVHLDLKPANVLIAADGQPMLLDFHLAQSALTKGEPAPAWLGGTPLYMAPEQERALRAIHDKLPLAETVDARADIYSLGILLYQSLGGTLPVDLSGGFTLHRKNPGVSVGLADIIRRCLANKLEDRYASAADLANDLRRHLADLPLLGVKNRSWRERWRKWRRRRPYGLALSGAAVACLAGATMLGFWLVDRWQEPFQALEHGRSLLERGDPSRAAEVFDQGLRQANRWYAPEAIRRQLAEDFELAQTHLARRQREAASAELRSIADKLRFLHGTGRLTSSQAVEVARTCRAIWATRRRLLPASSSLADENVQVREDLVDVVLFWHQVATHHLSQDAVLQEEITEAIREAESELGPRFLIVRNPTYAPKTAWDFLLRGRSAFQKSQWKEANADFLEGIERDPSAFWLRFYQGMVAFRLEEFANARAAFDICIALAPNSAACYHNRALTYKALGDAEQAKRDVRRALELDPSLSEARELLMQLQ